MDATTRPRFNVIKECRYGTMLYNQHDLFIGKSLELYGEYSPGEAELFGRLLRPGDVVLEVGANIGVHTLFIAQTIAPQGFVVALEPQRLVFQTLCANMALNSVANAICLQLAAGDMPGSINVPVLDPSRPNNFGGLELGGSQPGETVSVVPLDSLPISRLKLLKVDVEGMEAVVLRGARGLIAKFRPVLYVEDDRPQKSEELLALIRSLNYAIYLHFPPYYSPRNFRGNPENVFPQIGSRNLLCFPEEAAVKVEDLPRL